MKLKQLLFISLLLPATVSQTLTAQGRKAATMKPRPAYSFGEVIEALESKLDVVKLVNTYGVGFKSMTPEMGAVLRQLNASDALMSSLPKLPPPPPPPAVSGDLNVHCEPVDCFVEVGKKAFGRSENGTKIIRDLPPGDGSIRITADGFEDITQPIKLKPDAPETVSFGLKRTASQAKYRFEDLLFRSIQAAGGLASLAEFQGKRLEGTILPYGPGKGLWNLSVQPTAGSVLVTVWNDNGYCAETFPAAKLNPECSRKGAPPTALLSLTYEVYRDAMPPAIVASVMDDISRNDVTVEESANGFRFSGKVFSLRTDKDMLPVSATKLTDGGSVAFNDWVPSETHKYPGRLVFNRNGPNLEPLLSATLKVVVTAPPSAKKGGRR